MFTIDASVWINGDSPNEPEHRSSRALLDRVALDQSSVIVPTILLVESAASISRVRRDVAMALQYSETLAALTFIQWIELDFPMARQAAKLAAEYALRGADSVYAAVAISHQCELITLDNEVLKKLAGVIIVRSPRDALAHHWQISV